MHSYSLLRLILLLLLVGCSSLLVRANVPSFDPAAALLPDGVGSYRALGPPRPGGPTKGDDRAPIHDELKRDAQDENLAELANATAGRTYGAGREQFSVQVTITASDAHAYALLTNRMPELGESALTQTLSFGDIGIASIVAPGRILFCKGSVFVGVNRPGGKTGDPAAMLMFARDFANTLASQDNSVPVLVQHLPDWPNSRVHAAYSVTLVGLNETVRNQPILNDLNFEGGTEAVTANYGSSQLVIVEFTTPQLAGDNDRHIIEKLHELWQQGKPSPTGYRRVGNYLVFVFNAPNAQTANQLIDQVKYEQVVQWLGDNPNWLKEAQRRYTETMLGTFVGVIKTSGLAAVLCFGVGGFFGALLFMKRRAEQRAYSDAGGMMRLNLDEMTADPDARKLIGPGIPDKT